MTPHSQRSSFLQSGQSLAEYLVITALLVLALAVGPRSAMEQLFDAVAERYQRFSQEASRP